MRLTAVEVTTVAGQKVRLELDVPIGEDLKGFDFSRWFHHFWIHFGRDLDGPPGIAVPFPRGADPIRPWWQVDEFDRGGFGR